MVVWCVKERDSVNLFQRFRAVFYRLPRLVRARFAQVFRRLKRAFVSTLRVVDDELMLNVLRCHVTY